MKGLLLGVAVKNQKKIREVASQKVQEIKRKVHNATSDNKIPETKKK